MHGTVGKASSADSTLVLHLLSKSPNCKRRRTCPRETTKKNTDFGSKRLKKGGQTSVVVAQTQANAKCIFKAGDFSWPIGINSFPNKKNTVNSLHQVIHSSRTSSKQSKTPTYRYSSTSAPPKSQNELCTKSATSIQSTLKSIGFIDVHSNML